MRRGNRRENWYFVGGEYCYCPPTWQYTKKQRELMTLMSHRHMPANVTDRLLAGRRLERLSNAACTRLSKQVEDEYKIWGLAWYRTPWKAQ
jgi:hypothetical protein